MSYSVFFSRTQRGNYITITTFNRDHLYAVYTLFIIQVSRLDNCNSLTIDDTFYRQFTLDVGKCVRKSALDEFNDIPLGKL